MLYKFWINFAISTRRKGKKEGNKLNEKWKRHSLAREQVSFSHLQIWFEFPVSGNRFVVSNFQFSLRRMRINLAPLCKSMFHFVSIYFLGSARRCRLPENILHGLAYAETTLGLAYAETTLGLAYAETTLGFGYAETTLGSAFMETTLG